jgi:hypothetical protein
MFSISPFIFLIVKSIFSHADFQTVSMSSLGVVISWLLICDKTSHISIPACSAILHSTGLSKTPGLFKRNQSDIACSYVGIIFTFKSVSILVLIQIGFTHIIKSIENIIAARRKFINTHQSIIIACL